MPDVLGKRSKRFISGTEKIERQRARQVFESQAARGAATGAAAAVQARPAPKATRSPAETRRLFREAVRRRRAKERGL